MTLSKGLYQAGRPFDSRNLHEPNWMLNKLITSSLGKEKRQMMKCFFTMDLQICKQQLPVLLFWAPVQSCGNSFVRIKLLAKLHSQSPEEASPQNAKLCVGNSFKSNTFVYLQAFNLIIRATFRITNIGRAPWTPNSGRITGEDGKRRQFEHIKSSNCQNFDSNIVEFYVQQAE